jgi:hypothetical protein
MASEAGNVRIGAQQFHISLNRKTSGISPPSELDFERLGKNLAALSKISFLASAAPSPPMRRISVRDTPIHDVRSSKNKAIVHFKL